MNIVVQIEQSASSSQSKHEGESSYGLCDRLSRTRDNNQRQLIVDRAFGIGPSTVGEAIAVIGESSTSRLPDLWSRATSQTFSVYA